MTPPGVFVTATNTEAGKTYVSCEILKTAAAKGLHVQGVKPMVTGANSRDGLLLPGDALLLMEASSPQAPLAQVSHTVLQIPVGPVYAARQEGVKLHGPELAAFVEKQKAPDKMLVVEGIGGVAVPLDEKGYLVTDLMAAVDLPVVLVVPLVLGSINHTLLTMQALLAKNIKVACMVINDLTGVDPATAASTREGIKAFYPDIPFVEAGKDQHGFGELIYQIVSRFAHG